MNALGKLAVLGLGVFALGAARDRKRGGKGKDGTFTEQEVFGGGKGKDGTFTTDEVFGGKGEQHAKDDPKHPHHRNSKHVEIPDQDSDDIKRAIQEGIEAAERDAKPEPKHKKKKRKVVEHHDEPVVVKKHKKKRRHVEQSSSSSSSSSPAPEPAPAPRPSNIPPGYDPDKARELAPALARHIINARYNTDKRLVRTFQVYAGFPKNLQTGNYGNDTWGALKYFIQYSDEPYQPVPRALFKPTQPTPYTPPA